MALDSFLLNQIATAAAKRKPLDVVVYLRSPVGLKTLTSEDAETLAQRVLQRTEQSVGESPTHFTIFENLNALSVGASPAFIKHLANQPEVLTVKTSQPSESFAFEPRKTPTAHGARKRPRKVR